MAASVHLSDRIGRRMKLHDLHVLMTVVQVGSMGEAAQRLHTSQSAISRSIAELEAAFGVRLLDRNRHGIQPTEYGRSLLDCGVAVFDELRRGVKNIESLADPTAGEVRLGTIDALAATFVSVIIDRISQRHPRIAFHLITDDLGPLNRQLSERNVDLLIVQRFNVFPEEKVDFEVLYDASCAIAAGAKSPWARRRQIRLADLMDESWVLPPPESGFGPTAVNAFRASGLEYPRATVVTAQADTRLSLLKSGRLLSIFTTSVFPTKQSDVKVLPVALPVAHAPVGIVTLRGRTLSPVARLFVNGARETAKLIAQGRL
jgi:DNA-binding transcriptional LysR family regulator